MIPAAGDRTARDPVCDYNRLASVLASRARRFGSRDPEGAAQEALRRSLENAKSQAAIEYYFGEGGASPAPEWPLDQLLAWLHGVLQNVVREERDRPGFRREISAFPVSDRADASPGALDALVERETRTVVAECFASLDRDYRDVLSLRLEGLKYGEIARRLGVNENTVATWVSRGIRELGRRIQKRMGGARE